MISRMIRAGIGLVVLSAVLVVVPPAASRSSGSRTFGDAVSFGSLAGRRLARPVVGIAPTPSGAGYWLVAADGGIFAFGDAGFHGSTGAVRLNQPIVGMTPTPSGNGYWFVAADGGVFAFGDARFAGSTGARHLRQPIVGMASSPTGRGYWLVSRDGGVFAFGDARFAGSAGGLGLTQPVVGLVATSTGAGYRIVLRDGRALPYGDAHALPPAGPVIPVPVAALSSTPDGAGYWVAGANGAVAAFGSAPAYGASDTHGGTVVGLAPTRSGRGYWLATDRGDVITRAAPGAVDSSGSYSFLSRNAAGTPMRYDPCLPVRYVVNPAGAPAGAVAEVNQAFRRLGAATGITFVDAGATTETHIRVGTGSRPSYQPLRYGVGRWAPILVSWVSASTEPILAGAVLGYGGSSSYWTSLAAPAYVTGEVVFDRDLSLVAPGFGPGLRRGNLVLHELGHVAGLDHVEDRSEVMYPSISAQSPDGYGPGDRAGLALLGAAQGCLATALPAA